MIAAVWVFLPVLSYYAHAAPPMAAGLEPPTRDLVAAHSQEESLSPPDKRLFKYILPSSQAWMSGEDTAALPTGQEGTKRGYNSRNYLRFGRSDEEKRGGRNFLRFGRGDISDYDTVEDLDDSIEKRGRNFLRFGRNPSRNFLRFGRSDVQDLGVSGGPMAFAEGLEDEVQDLPVEEKRGAHKNYLRFGRGNRNFLRFGRNDNRNFLRFGRSVDRQLTSLDCQGCQEQKKTRETTSSTPTPSHSSVSRAKHVSALHSSDNTESSESGETNNAQRFKRAAPSYYDYVALSPHSPASWAMEFQPEEDDIVDTSSSSSSSEEPQDMNKRSYNRSFLRFGRNRNFLRFGKRDGADSSSSSSSESSGPMVVVRPVEYPRYVRAPQRNFLRFG